MDLKVTWSTKPPPKPLRAVLGIAALAAVVGVSLYTSDIKTAVANLAGTHATPAPSPTSTRQAPAAASKPTRRELDRNRTNGF